MTDIDIVRVVALIAKAFQDQKVPSQLQEEHTGQWFRYSGSFSPSSMQIMEQGPQGTITITTTGSSTVQVSYNYQLAVQLTVSGRTTSYARSQTLSYEQFSYFDVTSSTLTIRGNQSYRFKAY